MSDAALRASLRLPCSCFSDTFLPVLSLLRRFPRRFIWRFPLCEDSLVGRPAFSRVGGCTGLRFCIAPPDDTLRAPLCLPCSCFSDTFLPALSLLRRFPRRFIWRFPLYEDSLAARPVLSCVGSCTGLRFCVAPPDDTLCALLRLSMFMLLKQILARRFPSVKVPLPAARCFPLYGDSLAARPAFPVSEAAPACASALRPRTILCAPRFAFHVHAFQTRSFRRFPFCGDFPVGSSGAFLSMKIPSPPAPCFPVSEAAPACASALRPRTILCAPCFAFPCSCFSSKFSPGAFPL